MQCGLVTNSLQLCSAYWVTNSLQPEVSKILKLPDNLHQLTNPIRNANKDTQRLTKRLATRKASALIKNCRQRRCSGKDTLLCRSSDIITSWYMQTKINNPTRKPRTKICHPSRPIYFLYLQWKLHKTDLNSTKLHTQTLSIEYTAASKGIRHWNVTRTAIEISSCKTQDKKIRPHGWQHDRVTEITRENSY